MATEASDRAIATRRVQLASGVDAFLALPEPAGACPCVILLHERYGLVQHTLDLAARFAREGHVCLAPNLFARHPERERLARGEITAPLPDPRVRADVEAGIAFLRDEGAADTSRLAVMGVCATGRFPLVVAADRPDVSACVAFYGGAQARDWEVTEDRPEAYEALIARLRCPVLGVFGEGDHVIAVDEVRRFRDVLERHRKSYLIKLFADVPHGWLNDTMPGRYRREAAEAAWALLHDFLARVWAGGYPGDRVRWAFESDMASDYDPKAQVRME